MHKTKLNSIVKSKGKKERETKGNKGDDIDGKLNPGLGDLILRHFFYFAYHLIQKFDSTEFKRLF